MDDIDDYLNVLLDSNAIEFDEFKELSNWSEIQMENYRLTQPRYRRYGV